MSRNVMNISAASADFSAPIEKSAKTHTKEFNFDEESPNDVSSFLCAETVEAGQSLHISSLAFSQDAVSSDENIGELEQNTFDEMFALIQQHFPETFHSVVQNTFQEEVFTKQNKEGYSIFWSFVKILEKVLGEKIPVVESNDDFEAIDTILESPWEVELCTEHPYSQHEPEHQQKKAKAAPPQHKCSELVEMPTFSPTVFDVPEFSPFGESSFGASSSFRRNLQLSDSSSGSCGSPGATKSKAYVYKSNNTGYIVCWPKPLPSSSSSSLPSTATFSSGSSFSKNNMPACENGRSADGTFVLSFDRVQSGPAEKVVRAVLNAQPSLPPPGATCQYAVLDEAHPALQSYQRRYSREFSLFFHSYSLCVGCDLASQKPVKKKRVFAKKHAWTYWNSLKTGVLPPALDPCRRMFLLEYKGRLLARGSSLRGDFTMLYDDHGASPSAFTALRAIAPPLPPPQPLPPKPTSLPTPLPQLQTLSSTAEPPTAEPSGQAMSLDITVDEGETQTQTQTQSDSQEIYASSPLPSSLESLSSDCPMQGVPQLHAVGGGGGEGFEDFHSRKRKRLGAKENWTENGGNPVGGDEEEEGCSTALAAAGELRSMLEGVGEYPYLSLHLQIGTTSFHTLRLTVDPVHVQVVHTDPTRKDPVDCFNWADAHVSGGAYPSQQ